MNRKLAGLFGSFLAPGQVGSRKKDINTSKAVSVAGRLGPIAFAIAMGGCALEGGAYADEEELGSVSSAFTSNQCASASAAATFVGQFIWNSPSNYGGACNAVDHAGASPAGYMPYGASITANQRPTTQATCEATYIRTVFYKKNSSGAWVAQKDESHYGVWQAAPFGGMECVNLDTSYPPQGSGVEVRMATTARRASGSSFVTYPITASIWKKPS